MNDQQAAPITSGTFATRDFARVLGLFILCTVGSSLPSCTSREPASPKPAARYSAHWGYDSLDGPARWASMDPRWRLCAEGDEQSPIDLEPSSPGQLPDVLLDLPSDEEVEVLMQAGVLTELDNGHTIQINAKTGETLTIGGKAYALLQFHFHAPSEHTMGGEHFPMEMHLVHQAEDGALAVVGMLIAEGAHNTAIEPLWRQLPKASGTETVLRLPTDFGRKLLLSPSAGVYFYRGSLTTPPCTEGVRWYVRKNPIVLSRQQIDAFRAVYDHNNRPVQPLGNRMLHRDDDPTLRIR